MKAIRTKTVNNSFVVVRASTGTYIASGGMLGLTKDVTDAQTFSTAEVARAWVDNLRVNMDRRWAARGGNHPYRDLIVRPLEVVRTYTVR